MKDEVSYVWESCGEEIVVPIDLSAGSEQEYVEDCPVCCWGDFHFGNVQGQMDCRLTTRDGEPAVKWTWDGNAEMDAAQGAESGLSFEMANFTA